MAAQLSPSQEGLSSVRKKLFKEIRCENLDSINLFQDKDRWHLK
jgi:hypothetical protein